jgi:hypothetical protein
MLSRRRDPASFKPREANATVSVVPSNLSESPKNSQPFPGRSSIRVPRVLRRDVATAD